MVKKKVHSSHHMQRKWHKNGIKKPKTFVKNSLKSLYVKMVINSRHAKKHDIRQNKKFKPKVKS